MLITRRIIQKLYVNGQTTFPILKLEINTDKGKYERNICVKKNNDICKLTGPLTPVITQDELHFKANELATRDNFQREIADRMLFIIFQYIKCNRIFFKFKFRYIFFLTSGTRSLHNFIGRPGIHCSPVTACRVLLLISYVLRYGT